jgi:Zn-finger nucleic acid-binding protein
MKCPRCNTILVISDKQGIELDNCPNCRGVWLDRGELDKIIEQSVISQGQPNYNPQNHFNDSHDYQQHDYYKHKKKGWLQELFD